ncbi:VOC family protein [Diaphorobacter aerolatus]|uniref:VOC family protein n=1 Tax=Diaphorobacter aerolatus TaxID=1288495 RepID=UPI001D004D69|nr:VOC family protein [Diaphorobacter aerolatus]
MSANRSVINWFEIPCTDLPRAQVFYESMLARKMRLDDCGGTPMVIFAYDDPATGGCLVGSGKLTPSHDGGVRIYLDCEPSVEAAMERARKAGGQVLDECVELPGTSASWPMCATPRATPSGCTPRTVERLAA